jgi:hypothetical protein
MSGLVIVERDADGLLGASCTLGAADISARIAEWASLRERASSVRPIDGGLALTLPAEVPISDVADLATRESECCSFYAFTLRIEGPRRELLISAGAGRQAAVEALLGW